MEVNLNKSVLEKSVPTALKPETSAVTAEFSLILDQEVSKTQEKTAAAETQAKTPQTRGRIKKNNITAPEEKKSARILDFTPPVSVEPRPAKIKQKDVSPEKTVKDINEDGQELNAAPSGLIQTQIQTLAEKINFRGGSVDELERTAEKPAPPNRPVSQPDFAEVYAAVLQTIRARRDGQIVKLKFALEPAELGRLDLYVFADKKNLRIAFASGAEAKKILESARGELESLLTGFGFSLSDLDFSGYSGARHQELESRFLAQSAEKIDYGILKNIPKKDIMNEVKYLIRDVLVNYLA
ncbi:MAG: flagellar hook-length control protein FliK [Candidatus Margulisbacteria bacterium]|jgi:hypothetical protein|nr:flagellar hook-length control protein FliK [Candidatus Margulisiibacteriota bacterium]